MRIAINLQVVPRMAKVVMLNKPYDVLCQFTDNQGRKTLSDYIKETTLKGFYPAGRLDRDSEGLVLLTDNGQLQHRIAHPDKKLAKTYWVQVEGEPTFADIALLQSGVELNDGITKPAKAILIKPPPKIWPRIPPIRKRDSIPTQWIELILTEGRNRQVRRMTAAIGCPTLRLIRASIGHWTLEGIEPGKYHIDEIHLPTPKQVRRVKPQRKK